MTGPVPRGWPAAVRPPGSPDWERSAVAWLLDVCPPDYRSHEVFRRHPVVLAWLAALSVSAAADAVRAGIAAARAELRDLVAPEAVEAALAALESEQRRLAGVAAAVSLVATALRGGRFVPRL